MSGEDVALHGGFLAFAAVVTTAALVASIVSARRALAINPTGALRVA